MYTRRVTKPRAVKGTYDVLPEDGPVWRALRASAVRVLESAGVQEIVPPVFEYAEIFEKSVGESADLVVQKEMYRFSDRGGRDLVLRPEFTAGVLRAYVEHGMHTRPSPVKLWSLGPAFRAENVQRGRFRQFHQLNCEILGLADPLVDAESIALLTAVLEDLGLRDLRVALGSVGDPEDRDAYNAYLRERLEPRAEELSDTSRERLRLNPMRVLDSKSETDQAIVAELDAPLDRLGGPARAHLDAVAGYLTDWGVRFDFAPSIVRGLDYYRRTAFEIHAEGIGAQSALAGGGRYDGLVESLGGPATPGVGWAMGVERVLDALASSGIRPDGTPGPDLFLVPMDDVAVAEVARTAQRLRPDLRVQHAYVRRAPGKGLRDADRTGARYAALRGERERERGTWTLKHLTSGEQREVPEDDLARAVRED